MGNKGERAKGLGVIEELIEKSGGCAVIDGGLSTRLEDHGANLNDPLWSASCLITEPNLIKQATIPGFVSRGLSLAESESLIRKSVTLARDARDSFWNSVQKIGSHGYNRALVAASIGSYGAYLADGSEYSGHYGPDVTVEKLKDFHRRRLQVLVDSGPDLLAFETIPNKLEAQVCVDLLCEENISIPSWICFSSTDGEHTSSGDSFQECLDITNKSERVNAVGINCTPPQFIENLVCAFRKLTDKPIVVYPNSGEVWDGCAKHWLPSKCFGDGQFKLAVRRWRDGGASLIGGCCRTTPSTIRFISKVLKGEELIH